MTRAAGRPAAPVSSTRASACSPRPCPWPGRPSPAIAPAASNALAASGAIGRDALTLAEWCVADGRIGSAVEALELGRALVLHAATVAADVPALLREAGSAGLAAEWASEASAVRAADGIDAIP